MQSWGKCIGCLKTGISLVDKNLKHILEFGVWKGRTLRLIRNSFDDSFQIFGFDSFIGLPCDWIGGRRTGGTINKGHFSTDGEIPDIPNVTFFKGWFEDTSLEYQQIAQSIGLIHIDGDLYSSAKIVLFNLNDFIVKNTILVFDEWRYGINQESNNEKQAFYEWVEKFNRKYEFSEFPRWKHPSMEQKLVRIL